MRSWTGQKSHLLLFAVLRVRVLAPSSTCPSSPDALHPTRRTAIATEGTVNGKPFHSAMRRVCCRRDLTPRDKLVYWALLDQANDNGLAWPSAASIAAMIGTHERGVRECFGKLIDAGVIRTEDRSGGRKSTRYQVANPAESAGLNPADTAGLESQPCGISTPPLLNQQATPAVFDTNPAESAPDRLRPSYMTDSLTVKPPTPFSAKDDTEDQTFEDTQRQADELFGQRSDAGVKAGRKQAAKPAPGSAKPRRVRPAQTSQVSHDEDAQDAEAVKSAPPLSAVEQALVDLSGGNPAMVRAMDKYKVDSLARTPATKARMVAALEESRRRGEDVDFALALFRRRTWKAADQASDEQPGSSFEMTPELQAIFDEQERKKA